MAGAGLPTAADFPVPDVATELSSSTGAGVANLVEALPRLDMDSKGEAASYHGALDLAVAGTAASPSSAEPEGGGYNFDSVDDWVCAICREKIAVEETAQIKGCEHSYCVTCILRWASYKPEPWCPQCRLPFTFVYVYKSIDGSLHDYMFEESICLLLRAPWFQGLPMLEVEEPEEYHDEDDVLEQYYYTSSLRIGNRRWGDNGYVRGGRREARPVSVRQVSAHDLDDDCLDGTSTSTVAKGKAPAKEKAGRRARRAQKREAADAAARTGIPVRLNTGGSSGG